MCGRYASTRSATDLAALFEAVDDTGGDLEPGFNLAPTRSIPIVRVSKSLEDRAVSLARWGLVPKWAKDPSIGSRMFNARVETVASSNAYRNAFKRRRCLVPADGWYEWLKMPDGKKQPYYFSFEDGSPLVFAGLWETWGDGPLMSTTILTTDAVGGLERVHDRMPLLLPPERWADWLGETDADPGELVEPPPLAMIGDLDLRPVSTAVGNVRNDGAYLTEKVTPPPAGSLGSTVEPGGEPTLF